MDSKKLSAIQIHQLHTFTKQHYVEWYDLQTELVDHLANAIESEWEINPSLSFETVINNEFKKFGVFGFMDVVKNKQKAMNKKYYNWVWNHFIAFFHLPKIIGTVLLVVAFFSVLKFGGTNFYVIKGLLLTMFAAIIVLFFNRRFKNKKELNQKKWLLENTIYSCGNFGGLIFLPINILLNLSNQPIFATNSYFLFGISFFCVCCTLFFYIILFEIPSKAQAYLEKTYPEYIKP